MIKTFILQDNEGTWKYWVEKDLEGRSNLVAIKRLK